MRDKRQRVRQEFWLDVSKAEDTDMLQLINDLKQMKTFSKVVRSGIRLIVDLWNGKLDVLLELFPDIENLFYQRFLEQQPTAETSIHEQLKRLEQLLIKQGNTPIETTAQPVAVASGSPKAMAVPKVASPVFEDDDEIELVVTKAKTDGKSAQNFLDSAFNLLG